MASMGVNVLRYSALGAGVVYGLYHQSKITTASKASAINREYEHKQSLIQQAKAEYSRSKLPQNKQTEGGDIIRDPEDPNFNLETFLNSFTAANK